LGDNGGIFVLVVLVCVVFVVFVVFVDFVVFVSVVGFVGFVGFVVVFDVVFVVIDSGVVGVVFAVVGFVVVVGFINGFVVVFVDGFLVIWRGFVGSRGGKGQPLNSNASACGGSKLEIHCTSLWRRYSITEVLFTYLLKNRKSY
jgi:hypothetical protein